MNTTNLQLNQPRSIDLSRYETVTQTQPSPTVSDKYKFIPTRRVLDVLADHGWHSVSIREARTLKEENRGYQKHAIALVNESMNRALEVGDTVPRLLLTNSHAGTASFSFHISLFELVCKNGLIVDRVASCLRVQHRGYADFRVEQILAEIISGIHFALEEAERFKAIYLDDYEREQFAKKAIELRWDGEQYSINPTDVLDARRAAQREPTLWNTFNVIQESLIQGGARQRRKDGSRTRSRAVTGIDQSIKLNQELWRMTEMIAVSKPR